MSNSLERIEDAVATLLGGGATEREVIITMVKTIASSPQYAGKITDEDILNLTKKLETRFDISMGIHYRTLFTPSPKRASPPR